MSGSTVTTDAVTLRFDADEHRYWWGEQPLLSVTQILHLAGCIDDAWFSGFGRLRGEYVHTMLEWADRGELEEQSVDPGLRPYLEAYRQFLTDAGAVWDLVEHRCADPDRGYAGTLDRCGPLGLVDIKTGRPEPFHAIQLAGYAQLLAATGLGSRYVPRYGLYLTSDGRYRLDRYEDRQDLTTFDAALAVASWRHRHGLDRR